MMKSGPLSKLAATIFCFGLLLTLSSTAEAKIIKQYTFENQSFDGVSLQYQDKTCSKSRAYIQGKLFSIVGQPARKGRYALQHHVKNCDERSELVIPRSFFKKDKEYWIGWSNYFPKNFIKPGKKSYTIIQQMSYIDGWIDQGSGKTLYECHRKLNKLKDGRPGLRTIGAPGSDMMISSSGDKFTYKLKYYKGRDNKGRAIFGCKSFEIPAEVDKWQDFVMHVKFSDNSNQGLIRLWKNGELYMDEKVALMPPWKDKMDAWKIGAYVGDPGHGERLLYTDELKVGDSTSSYQEVSPGSPAPEAQEDSSDANSSSTSSKDKNLALKQFVSVSSQQKGNPGKNAVDGKIDSYWTT